MGKASTKVTNGIMKPSQHFTLKVLIILVLHSIYRYEA